MYATPSRSYVIRCLSLLLACLMLLGSLAACGFLAADKTDDSTDSITDIPSVPTTDTSGETHSSSEGDTNAENDPVTENGSIHSTEDSNAEPTNPEEGPADSNTEKETEVESEPESETTAPIEDAYVPAIDKKNYNKDFNITNVYFDKDWLVIDEENVRSGNVLDETVFERCVRIKDHLGVTCVLADAGSWTEYTDKIKRTIQTGEDAYQLVTTHVHQGVTTLAAGENLLLDLSELPAVNLEASYWNKNVMEQLKIQDRYLLGYNDFLLSNTHCLTFNKDLLATYGLESPYALVRNKTWTLDKLFEMASVAAKENGDGVWDEQDQYGLTGWGWIFLISFLTSSDMTIVDRDPDTGKYSISYEREGIKLQNMIDKIYSMYTADWSYMWPSTYNTTVDISTGRALFQLYNTTSLSSLATTDIRFGVLPYPLYDTAQEEYKTLNWNGLMCVPASVQDKQMVGEVLELLAYYTAPVKTAYYETQLGTAVINAPEDAEMLDIIWNSQTNDIGLICTDTMFEIVYMVPLLCEQGNGNVSYSSFYKTYKKSATRSLNKLLNQ